MIRARMIVGLAMATLALLATAPVLVWAAQPQIIWLSAAQRTDGSKLVDIRYGWTNPSGDSVGVSLSAYLLPDTITPYPCPTLTGTAGVLYGTGADSAHAVWNAGVDLPGRELRDMRLRLDIHTFGVFPPLLTYERYRPPDGDAELWRSNDDGTRRAPIASADMGFNALHWDVAWSPDGQRIAFTELPSPRPTDAFHLYTAEASLFAPITTRLFGGVTPVSPFTGLAWHPSGQYIVTTTNSPSSGGGIRVFDTSGFGVTRTIESCVACWYVTGPIVFTSDGTQLFYVHRTDTMPGAHTRLYQHSWTDTVGPTIIAGDSTSTSARIGGISSDGTLLGYALQSGFMEWRNHSFSDSICDSCTPGRVETRVRYVTAGLPDVVLSTDSIYQGACWSAPLFAKGAHVVMWLRPENTAGGCWAMRVDLDSGVRDSLELYSPGAAGNRAYMGSVGENYAYISETYTSTSGVVLRVATVGFMFPEVLIDHPGSQNLYPTIAPH